MAKCSVCDHETQLYIGGRPLCSRCDLRRTQRKREAVEVLWGEVLLAKTAHKELSDRFDILNNEVIKGGHGIPYPDSTHRIEELGNQRRAAFREYERAMALYVEALKGS